MSGAIALIFGLCALSFAAGCVLTAFMLRREPDPEPPPAPGPQEPRLDVPWPPEDYATRPIHRNPVVGMPHAPLPVEPVRPALTLVPAPAGPEPESARPSPPALPAQAEPDLVPGADPEPEPGVEPARNPEQPEPAPDGRAHPNDAGELRQRRAGAVEAVRRRSGG